MGAKIFWEPIAESQVRVFVATNKSMSGEAFGRALFSGGLLEFRLVHENSDELVHQGEVPVGYELLERENRLAEGAKRTEQVVVKDSPEPGLARNLIKHAAVSRDALGKPQIDFVMRPEAASAFSVVTRANVGRRLAIILDGKLYSAPVIRSPIEAGRGQISGDFELREAFQLAAALEAPLSIPVKVVESKSY